MKVSVILPVYNGEKFINRAIHSVLNQSFRDIEIVIVDDCSRDNTKGAIFSEFGKLIGKNIIYHRNDTNRERSYSRNTGVELSKGEFIFFLDYDDEWEERYIEESVIHLRDFDIVYSFPRTLIDEDGNVIRVSKKVLAEDEGRIIFSGQIGYPSASGFRRSSFLGYREDIILREDWEIFIRSYLQGLKIKVIDNNQVKIREHSSRTSRQIKMLLSTMKVYQDYIDRIPQLYKADFLFHIADISMRFGDIPTGWRLLKQALGEDISIIRNKRNILSILKRGLRIDRYIQLRKLKACVKT